MSLASEDNENMADIRIVVDRLIEEAHELLSDTLAATKDIDNRHKQQGVDWTRRHRLHVLVEAAEDSRARLPQLVVAPWFLAELRTTLNVVRRWRDKPSWREIEPSLKVGHQFAHTILKLHLADHLEASGHKVQVVPRRPIRSPDLQFRAIGGSEELV